MLKRGTVVDIIEKAEVMLLDQFLGSKSEADDKQLAQVSRDDKGFMLSLLEEPCFRFRVGSICFFLDMNCQIDVGEIDKPEHSFQIVYLDFPKIRVNFNGFRVTTTEKNQNWSSYYVINERSQAKSGLHLERLNHKDETVPGGNNGSSGGQKEGQNVSGENSITVLDQKQKEFFIGSDPNCTIKTSKGGTMGVIKYIEDIGWVVQANDPRIKDSKSSPLYGVFIKVKEPVRKLKLYEGMTFIMGQHMITAKELH